MEEQAIDTAVKFRYPFRCILHHLKDIPDAILHCRKSRLHVSSQFLSPLQHIRNGTYHPQLVSFFPILLFWGGSCKTNKKKKKIKILSYDSISHAKGCTSIVSKENTDILAIEEDGAGTGNSTGCPYKAPQPTVSKDLPVPHREPEMGCPWKTGSEFSARRGEFNLLFFWEVLWYPKKSWFLHPRTPQ